MTLPIDTTGRANGTLTVTATVTDGIGNRGRAVRNLTVQNAGGGPAPLVASFTSPSAGATVSGTVTVGMAASGADGTPIAFTLVVDGVDRFNLSGSARTASFAWDTTSAANGSHTLALTVRDGAGRTATATRIVNVQNTAPPPGPLRVSVTAPADGATVSGTTWFGVWVDGAAAGSETSTLTIGGATVGSAVTTSSGPVSIPVDTRGVTNGTRTVTATVRASAAAAGSATRTVSVQN